MNTGKYIFASVLIVLIFWSNILNSQSRWFWVLPLPQGNGLTDIKFAGSSTTGWACGKCGTILKTTNSGINWVIQPIPIEKNINAIFVIDNQNILACGDKGTFIYSENGGASWITRTVDTSLNFLSLHFENINTGWISGNNGRIMKTMNKGQSWEIQNINSTRYVNSTWFVNLNTGYATVDYGVPRKTTNGGTVWDSISSFTQNIYLSSVLFKNDNTGFILASDHFYRTQDAGLTWNSSFLSGINMLKMSFIDATKGWITAFNPSYPNYGYKIYSTDDGGINFSWKEFSRFEKPESLDMISSTSGFFVTDSSNIYFTGNSNTSFTNCTPGDKSTLIYTRFFDDMTGYICSANSIRKTTNGGINWVYKTILNKIINCSCFPSLNTGYIFAETYIYKTTNGGNNWSTIPTQFIDKLNRGFFINDNTGWFIGPAGRVMKTIDGASTWSIFLTGCPSIENDIFFIDQNTGWITSGDYQNYNGIYKTTNGGTTWIFSSTGGNANAPYFIYFANPSTGWLAGLNILKSTDGGTTWHYQPGNDDEVLNSLFFTNSSTGWAAGNNGLIVYTQDGGNSWHKQYKLTNNALNSLYFSNSNTGWAAGKKGTLIKTTIGGSIGINKYNSRIPENMILYQNFPNPFNPSTTIKFDIPKSSYVKLSVYDITGKKIETLVNEQLATGSYETKWDGTRYTSGVYFCILTANNERLAIRRMVLIK